MQSPLRHTRNRSETTAKKETPLRCLCGSLLARLVPEGVELKCRRCKRQVIVPLEEDAFAKTDLN
jgi:phage FluMu protein Com